MRRRASRTVQPQPVQNEHGPRRCARPVQAPVQARPGPKAPRRPTRPHEAPTLEANVETAACGVEWQALDLVAPLPRPATPHPPERPQTRKHWPPHLHPPHHGAGAPVRAVQVSTTRSFLCEIGHSCARATENSWTNGVSLFFAAVQSLQKVFPYLCSLGPVINSCPAAPCCALLRPAAARGAWVDSACE